jgi:excisionase family DNA binding protein
MIYGRRRLSGKVPGWNVAERTVPAREKTLYTTTRAGVTKTADSLGKETDSMPEHRYLSTAEVAVALGVGVTTVKRWVDEGVLPAHKTAGGHRKLLPADVLRAVRTQQLPHVDLSRLPFAAAGVVDAQELCQKLFAALRGGDAEATRGVIRRAYHGGLPPGELADHVVAPAMRRMGHDWETGCLDVMHEHRGTAQCTAALYELRAVLGAHAAARRPLAVGGTPEKDPYVLANLLAELVLLDAGWAVVNLGPNTPAASFRRAVAELRPRLLWLSVGHLEDPRHFFTEYAVLYRDAQQAGAAVAVGGQALKEEVRAKLPYTTFGDGLAHLAAFARSLHAPPRPRPRGRPRRSASLP